VIFVQNIAPVLQDGWEGGVEGGTAVSLPGPVLRRLHGWVHSFATSGAYNALMQVGGTGY
jgi:hypothetical protein